MKSKLDVVAPKSNRRTDKYWVPVVAKTIDLLDCFSSEAESLTLEEVVKRTKIPHTTAYRILHTLVCRNYLQQSGRLYRLNRLRKRLKVGFANLSMRISLAVEIQRSLEKASSAAGIDLMIWDNNRDADIVFARRVGSSDPQRPSPHPDAHPCSVFRLCRADKRRWIARRDSYSRQPHRAYRDGLSRGSWPSGRHNGMGSGEQGRLRSDCSEGCGASQTISDDRGFARAAVSGRYLR